MQFGVSWYPEHWPAERWPVDLRLMREAGMTVVRLADFAWSRLEPDEGRFDLDWLASAVDLAYEHGLRCVLATPTAGPPIWLTHGHPDVLAVDADGRRRTHGNRTHASLTSERFRTASVRIAGALAERFGDHPAVLGWQIDNEVNTISYDEVTAGLFRRWLAERYGTIEALNERWGTVFWSQEYRDFAQIPLPIGVHHPSLALAWHRYLTDMFRDHLRAQIDAVRRHAGDRQWISHNVMTFVDHYDQHVVAADLDLVGLDFYPGHLDHPDAGAAHDATRGLRRRNHWVMETHPGHNCWSGINGELVRGEARRLAWHAVGHGADGLLYWQWRAAPGGQEQYHGTLLGADGRPRLFYEEAARIGREFAAAAPALAGTEPRARVAILQGYPDRWAIDGQRHHRDFDPVNYLLSFYRPLSLAGHEIDIVAPAAPLEDYRLVVAPSLHLADDRLAERLSAWVSGGGHLVLGCRTGMKDGENVLLPSRQPGPLRAGVSVVDFAALERPVPVVGDVLDGEPGSAAIWAEILEPEVDEHEVLLRYGVADGWLDGRPAVVTVPVGAGRVTYLGAWLEEAPMAAVVRRVLSAAGLSPRLVAPAGVEICRRTGVDHDVLIVINHCDGERKVDLGAPAVDGFTGVTTEPWVLIKAGDVRIFTITHQVVN